MRVALQVDPSKFYYFRLRKNPPPDFINFMEGFMEFLAVKMIKELKSAINKQKYKKDWESLSATWVKRKKSLKLDPRIWKASGETMESIRWWYSRVDDCYYVGVHPRKMHHVYKSGGIYKSKKGKALIIDIIRWLEFGTRYMKPRPLFTPVLIDMRKRLPEFYQEYITSVKGKRAFKKVVTAGKPIGVTFPKSSTKKKVSAKTVKKAPSVAVTKTSKKKAVKTVAKKNKGNAKPVKSAPAPVAKKPQKKTGKKGK